VEFFDSFYEWVLRLRNQLLMYRFRELPHVKADVAFVNRNVEPRLNRIAIPLVSVSKEDEFVKDLNAFIEQDQRDIVTDRATRWEADVLSALLQLHDTKTEHGYTMSETDRGCEGFLHLSADYDRAAYRHAEIRGAQPEVDRR